MRRQVVFVALVILIAGAGRAAAQTCTGLPAIGLNSKGNIGASLAVGNRLLPISDERSSTVGVGANVTYGSERMYGAFGIGKTNYTGFEFTTTVVSFTLGGQLSVRKDKPISICPFGTAAGEWAGNLNQAGLTMSTDLGAGGAHVGFKLGSSERREMIPTLGIAIGRIRDTASIPGARLSERNTVGVFNAGMGFIFDKRFALRPAFSYPIGLPGAHVTFSMLASIAYGHR